jgi:hypothetical protein
VRSSIRAIGSSMVRCCIYIWFQRVLHHNLGLGRDLLGADSGLPPPCMAIRPFNRALPKEDRLILKKRSFLRTALASILKERVTQIYERK